VTSLFEIPGDNDVLLRVDIKAGAVRSPSLQGGRTNLGVLQDDGDYHRLRAAMVIVFFFFGYQKWWARPDLPQRGRSHNLCQPTRRKPKPWPANRLRRSPRRRSGAPRRG